MTGAEGTAAHHLALAQLHGVAQAIISHADRRGWTVLDAAALAALGAEVEHCDRTLARMLAVTKAELDALPKAAS